MGEHTDLRAAYMEDVANLLAEIEQLRAAEDRALDYARQLAHLRNERQRLIEMLTLCEAHCSDGYIAEQARDLLRRIDEDGA